MKKRFKYAINILIALTFVIGASTVALGEEFYKRKVVRMIVGYGPGGGPDFRTRLVARHLGRHLPGRPKVIVQNMPGGGGIVATNYIFNVAKPTGLVLSNVARGPFMMQMGKRVGVLFDMEKFQWIGSLMREGNVVFIRSSTPYRNLEDLKKAKKPLIFGARSVGATNYLAAKALEMLGVPVKLVVGYGTSKMNLAFEQGEIEASALGWTSIKTGRPDWIKPGGLARLIVEFGMEATREIQVAFGPKLKPIGGKEQIYSVINKALGLSQANLAAPPGTPRDRVDQLRQAYRKMLKDPKFQAHAAKLNIPLNPLVGGELGRTVQKFYGEVSASTKAQFAELLR